MEVGEQVSMGEQADTLGADVVLGEHGDPLVILEVLDLARVDTFPVETLPVERDREVSVMEQVPQSRPLPGADFLGAVILVGAEPVVVAQVGAALPPGPQGPDDVADYGSVKIHEYHSLNGMEVISLSRRLPRWDLSLGGTLPEAED
jgi:hypothetical protein